MFDIKPFFYKLFYFCNLCERREWFCPFQNWCLSKSNRCVIKARLITDGGLLHQWSIAITSGIYRIISLMSLRLVCFWSKRLRFLHRMAPIAFYNRFFGANAGKGSILDDFQFPMFLPSIDFRAATCLIWTRPGKHWYKCVSGASFVRLREPFVIDALSLSI